MQILRLTLLLSGLLACDGKETETPSIDTGDSGDTDEPVIDADADGYSAEEDCDDNSSSINPGAAEVCDGIDNNCDGSIDEGVTTTFYADGDADGYGSEDDTVDACEQPSEYITDGGDCNDSDAAINPDSKEVCDGADNNCDEVIDEGVTSSFYVDGDGDGYGSGDKTVEACEAAEGYAVTNDDCDDANDAISPGAGEACDGIDNDCDPATTEEGTVGWSDGKTKGIPSSPAEILLADAGDVTFCGGTWYVDVDITADVNLYGEGLPGDNILNGGFIGSVVSYPASATVTSSLENLTLTEGGGFYDKNYAATVGGGIRCESPSTITLSDMVISNADSGLGGGLYVSGACDIAAFDTEISENAASYGAGMIILDGSVSFTDSMIWGNVAEFTGGGAALEGASAATSLALVDTLVTENEGYYGAGLSAIYEATITCTGTGKGKIQAGVTDNYNTSALYGGGLLTYFSGYPKASVVVTDCDFGDDKYGDDNDPNDVYVYDLSEEYTDYGYGSSFTCDDGGCY